jgi:hypothetical protein
MSSDPYNPSPNPNQYDPTYTEPQSSGCRGYATGCGIVVATVLVLAAVGLYLAWPGFAKFGAQNDLAKFRDTVEAMNLDEAVRTELVAEFDKVRLSIDDHNNFAFMQWVEIEKEVTKLLTDGALTPDELKKLRAEIARMKKIQGI